MRENFCKLGYLNDDDNNLKRQQKIVRLLVLFLVNLTNLLSTYFGPGIMLSVKYSVKQKETQFVVSRASCTVRVRIKHLQKLNVELPTNNGLKKKESCHKRWHRVSWPGQDEGTIKLKPKDGHWKLRVVGDESYLGQLSRCLQCEDGWIGGRVDAGSPVSRFCQRRS